MSKADVEAYEPEEAKLMRYAKVYQLGDARLSELLNGPVQVTEKLDGSQFRWQKKEGRLLMGSHRVDFDEMHPVDNLFVIGAKYLESISDRIPEGLVFFGEFLPRTRQNTITYGRAARNGFYLFDVFNPAEEPIALCPNQELGSSYLLEPGGWAGGEELGWFSYLFDVDPPHVLFEGDGKELTEKKLLELLAQQSYLGGSLQEGIVVKNYALSSPDPYHPMTMQAGKYVRRSFKEENDAAWRGQRDISGQLQLRFKTEARWEKAIVHAREDGKLNGNMTDIRPLLEELDRDIDEEIAPLARGMLWEHFEGGLRRGIKGGFAEWYKRKLLGAQFGEKEGQVEKGVKE